MVENVYFHLIIFLAGFTQGFTGFGSVLVGLPLLTILLDVRAAVPLICLLALCISIILTTQLRAHFHWLRVRSLLLPAVPGIIFGVYALKSVPQEFLEVVIGLVLILFPLYLFGSKAPQSGIPERWAWAFGFLSGILGGSIGANGPPVIIYTMQQPWGKYSIKSVLVGYFLISGICISSVHAVNGLITDQVLIYFASGLPALVTGVLSGSFLFGRIDSTAYKRTLNVLLILLGIFMVGKAILN
jgi:uncharacterized membrane protein YfcA